jgi:hypothetical protein
VLQCRLVDSYQHQFGSQLGLFAPKVIGWRGKAAAAVSEAAVVAAAKETTAAWEADRAAIWADVWLSWSLRLLLIDNKTLFASTRPPLIAN